MILNEKTETDIGENDASWRAVCLLDDIPALGARVVRSECGDIAIFRNANNEVFALRDKCPHKGGPLSQGIVFGRNVTCPLHSWTIKLENGCAVSPDKGCTKSFPVRVEGGLVYIQLGSNRPTKS